MNTNKIEKIDSDATALQVADRIAALVTSENSLEAKMNKELQGVREQYGPAILSARKESAALRKMLSDYLKRKGVGERFFKPGQRSAESSCARFGWRLSAPSVKTLDSKTSEAEVAAALLEAGRVDFLILAEPKLNKPVLAASDLTPAELAGMGLRIVQTETFFCLPLDE